MTGMEFMEGRRLLTRFRSNMLMHRERRKESQILCHKSASTYMTGDPDIQDIT
jgi:hypothetical protein